MVAIGRIPHPTVLSIEQWSRARPRRAAAHLMAPRPRTCALKGAQKGRGRQGTVSKPYVMRDVVAGSDGGYRRASLGSPRHPPALASRCERAELRA